jgi:hypothetical protein
MIAAGGLLCLPIRYIARWENKRLGGSPSLSIDQIAGSANLPLPVRDPDDLPVPPTAPKAGIRFQDEIEMEPALTQSDPSGQAIHERTPFLQSDIDPINSQPA